MTKSRTAQAACLSFAVITTFAALAGMNALASHEYASSVLAAAARGATVQVVDVAARPVRG